MQKALHIGGIVLGYLACVMMIVVGAINSTPGVPGWKFVMFGIACAICATVALLEGAKAFPTLGLWKVGGKFKGLSDLATIVIVLILGVTSTIAAVA